MENVEEKYIHLKKGYFNLGARVGVLFSLTKGYHADMTTTTIRILFVPVYFNIYSVLHTPRYRTLQNFRFYSRGCLPICEYSFIMKS